jgi:hypothetical protein
VSVVQFRDPYLEMEHNHITAHLYYHVFDVRGSIYLGNVYDQLKVQLDVHVFRLYAAVCALEDG